MLPVLVIGPPLVVFGGGYWSWSLGYTLSNGSKRTRGGPKAPPPPPQTATTYGLGLATLGGGYFLFSRLAPKVKGVDYKSLNSIKALEAAAPKLGPSLAIKSVALLGSFFCSGVVQGLSALKGL